MNLPFKKIIKEQKMSIIIAMALSFLISALVKYKNPTENFLNFILYYVVPATISGLCLRWYYIKKKNKDKQNNDSK